MFSQSSIFRTIYFISIGIIFISIVRGDYSSSKNASMYESKWTSDRAKRGLFDDMPEILKIRIELATERVIDLVWVKQTEYLANQHLPVVSSVGIAHPNVMRNIGEFVVYYDLEKCSSVVYFRESDSMFGYIGLSYFIVSLPYKFDENGYYQGVIGEPYVITRSNAPLHILPSLPDVRGFRQPIDVELESEAGPSHKRPRIHRDLMEDDLPKIRDIRKAGNFYAYKQFYLEILVFVDYEIPDDYGVDMMFRKLQHEKLIMYINLAKIVIEDRSQPLRFIRNQVNGFTETVREMRRYLEANKREYPRDSFDQVFLITKRPIHEKPSLLSEIPEHNLYDARKDGQFYTVVPIAIVDVGADFAVAVHDISRRLNINYDLWQEGSAEPYQCSSIMQEGGSKCLNCLKWTDENKIQFRKFLSQNRNRCFLGNRPRSLKISGPSSQVGVRAQCKCFGYASSVVSLLNLKAREVDLSGCSKPLYCMKKIGTRQLRQKTVVPFDGTPCGTTKVVCWAGQCVPAK